MPFNAQPLRRIMDRRRIDYEGLSMEIHEVTKHLIMPEYLESFLTEKGEKPEREDLPNTDDLDALYEYASLVVDPFSREFYESPGNISFPSSDATECRTESVQDLMRQREQDKH